MGNKIGTIYWVSNPGDDHITDRLRKLATSYDLAEANVNYLTSEPGKAKFGVNIGGLRSLVQSEELITNFLKVASHVLERDFGVVSTSSYE
jgi:hypothetical protein